MHLLCEGNGVPLSCRFTAANGDERKEVAHLLCQIEGSRPADILFLEADRGYDSEKLRSLLVYKCIYPVIAYRKKPVERQSRMAAPLLPKMDRKIERLHAWIKRSFRRLQSRWERRASCWLGFIYCALSVMWVKK